MRKDFLALNGDYQTNPCFDLVEYSVVRADERFKSLDCQESVVMFF